MALQRRRRVPGWVMALAVLLVVVVGVPSGCYVYERRKAMGYRQEMVGIVHSQEVRKIIEEGLRNTDPHALDGRGVIRTYRIDDGSIRPSPMGGYFFNTIVNNDRKLSVSFGIDRRYIAGEGYGPIESGGVDPSVELADLLKKRYGKDWIETNYRSEKYRKAHLEEFPTPKKTRSDKSGEGDGSEE